MSIHTRFFETGTLDDMMSCPYVPSHVMAANRFQIHVVKCRKQNPKKAEEIEVCPYNNFHHYHKDDRDKHTAICAQYQHFMNSRRQNLNAAFPSAVVGQPLGGDAFGSTVAAAGADKSSVATRNARDEGKEDIDDDYAKEWE